MASEFAENEMVQGYFDGRKVDSPEPGPNHTASYRHGFQSGRDDLSKCCSAPFDVRRQMAEDAMAKDDGITVLPTPSQGAR